MAVWCVAFAMVQTIIFFFCICEGTSRELLVVTLCYTRRTLVVQRTVVVDSVIQVETRKFHVKFAVTESNLKCLVFLLNQYQEAIHASMLCCLSSMKNMIQTVHPSMKRLQ